MSKSRETLIEAYIAALPLAAVAIVSNADGKRCRIEMGGDLAPGETIQSRLYLKPSHAELVLSAIDQEGWTDQAPGTVAALIEQTATNLGARFQSPDDLRRAAESAVADIVAKVEGMNQAGGLKEINTKYKLYRQRQVAKAEKAMPYSAFIHRFTLKMVEQVAAMVR